MDSLTHIVIGAGVGEVFAGRKLGKKALVIGALLQSFPDIDFVASFWLNPVEDIVAHRGITHSILFAAIMAVGLAAFFNKRYAARQIGFRRWLWFCSAELALHLFLDAFNAYGTGWFEPFSTARVSFNSIYVADPLFSVLPIIAFLFLLFTRQSNPNRMKWIRIGLGSVCLYLSFSVFSKLKVFNDVEEIAAGKGISYNRYFTTPTPLNSVYWFVVLENDSGYNIGYRSLFERDMDMNFEYFPRNANLLSSMQNSKTVQHLVNFSQGFYVADQWGDSLVFSDLRFGQMVGWYKPRNRFAFYYFLHHEDNNELIIQRGRFQHWDRAAAAALWRGIRGRKISEPAGNKR